MENKKKKIRVAKTAFQAKWLEKLDANKTLVRKWAQQVSDDKYACFCILCKSKFKIDKGFDRINQHAKTAGHQTHAKSMENQTMLQVADETQSKSTSNTTISVPIATAKTSESNNNLEQLHGKKDKVEETSEKIIKLFNPRKEATKIELLWCLEIINRKNSTNSCQGIKELFTIMFHDAVPEAFSLSPKKANYLITDALGPYYKTILLSELKNVFFSLQFDETSNVKNKKELQTRVFFWAEEGKVIQRHLETRFIDKGDGKTIFKNLLGILESNGLSLNKLVTVSRDGPNVNKTVFNLFQKKQEELKNKTLIDIGSCFLHNVHNAFSKGLEELSIDISHFATDVYYFFHNKNDRWAKFEAIQSKLNLPNHVFERHLSTRWLTLGPAVKKIIEQLPALNEYFFKVASNEKNTCNKQSFLDIVQVLKKPFLKAYLVFVLYITEIFNQKFTLLMQKDQPLIHILFKQIETLVMIMMRSIVKPKRDKRIYDEKTDKYYDDVILTSDIMDSNNKLKQILDVSDNLLPLLEIDCGEEVQSMLQQFAKIDKLQFFKDIQGFYKQSILYLNSKIVNRSFLKNLQYLSPEKIKNSESSKSIIEIAKCLPLSDINLNVLNVEWTLLQIDDDVSFF